MRSLEILRKTFDDGFSFLHVKRQSAIWRGVEALIIGGRLWLTALGRDMSGAAKEKHRIKAADRLLGNPAIHAALDQIYQVIATYLLRGMTRPVILVDWTGCGPDRYLLRAGLPIGGRAILLHARVVSKEQLSARAVHEQFLAALVAIIPRHCRPIIVTDGGFYSHWFQEVVKLGWDFVGRIRGVVHVRIGQEVASVRKWMLLAGKRPKDLGIGRIGRLRRDGDCRLVLASKPKPKRRTRLTQKGTRGRRTNDRKYSANAREPWLLATSLTCNVRKVVAVYATRMQLEESFRDLKSSRFGWAFECVRSKKPPRTEVLLMLATLTTLATLTVGSAAEREGLAPQFQANTVRKRRVLSLHALGRRIISRAIEISDQKLRLGLAALRHALQLSAPLGRVPI